MDYQKDNSQQHNSPKGQNDVHREQSGQRNSQQNSQRQPASGVPPFSRAQQSGRSNGMGFVMRKSEKLTTALYMVTDIMSEKEPMKWRMRESAVDLLSDLTSAQNAGMGEMMATLNVVIKKVEKLVSFLDIAQSSHLVSEMNAAVLKKEYVALKNTIEGEWSALFEQTRNIFNDGFFNVPEEPVRLEEVNVREKESIDKRQNPAQLIQAPRNQNQQSRNEQRIGQSALRNISSHKIVTSPANDVRHVQPEPASIPKIEIGRTDETVQPQFSSAVEYPIASTHDSKNDIGMNENKNDRRTIILALIKQKPALTVKDIAKSIPTVSEKTIQRELLSMVADGVLVKRGERRWSTYSLRNI